MPAGLLCCRESDRVQKTTAALSSHTDVWTNVSKTPEDWYILAGVSVSYSTGTSVMAGKVRRRQPFLLVFFRGGTLSLASLPVQLPLLTVKPSHVDRDRSSVNGDRSQTATTAHSHGIFEFYFQNLNTKCSYSSDEEDKKYIFFLCWFETHENPPKMVRVVVRHDNQSQGRYEYKYDTVSIPFKKIPNRM